MIKYVYNNVYFFMYKFYYFIYFVTGIPYDLMLYLDDDTTNNSTNNIIKPICFKIWRMGVC